MGMISGLIEPEQVWAASVRTRLLEQRGRAGTAPPQQRAQFFREVIDRALEQVPARDRSAHLQALQELFPAWQTAPPAAATADGPDPAGPAKLSLRELVQELVNEAQRLKPEEKAEVLERLAAAGLCLTKPVPGSPGEWRAPDQFHEKFNLPKGTPLDTDRVLLLLHSVASALNTVLTHYEAVWQRLGELISRDEWGAPGDFRPRVGPALTQGAPPELNWDELLKDLERKRNRVRALLAATHDGAAFFRDEASKVVDTRLIQTAAKNAGYTPGTRDFKAFCWDWFERNADQYTPAKLQEAFHAAIVRAAKRAR